LSPKERANGARRDGPLVHAWKSNGLWLDGRHLRTIV
jgi:hypothetical protein